MIGKIISFEKNNFKIEELTQLTDIKQTKIGVNALTIFEKLL